MESGREDTGAAIAIVVGIMLLALCVPALPKAFKVAFNLGTPGTYVVGDVPECSVRC